MIINSAIRKILFTILLGALVFMQYGVGYLKNNLNQTTKKIYLAGGCFWGLEAYFSKLPGVLNAISGYANGNILNPTYKDVVTGTGGYSETVLLEYNPQKISLVDILNHYFEIVNPTTLNRQGNDIGTQYRSGIYYSDEQDAEIISKFIDTEKKNHDKPIVVEVMKLKNFYEAEEYHQKYLEKNPGGYCHIDLSAVDNYKKPDDDTIKEELTDLQYSVTQNNSTERAFTSPFNNNKEEGIYVDIVSGEPLFSSSDKYDSGSGWPSFTAPVKKSALKLIEDKSAGMSRIEARSTFADSHLGHLFYDGPLKKGGKRYCINGASLRFVPKAQMLKEGYGKYLK